MVASAVRRTRLEGKVIASANQQWVNQNNRLPGDIVRRLMFQAVGDYSAARSIRVGDGLLPRDEKDHLRSMDQIPPEQINEQGWPTQVNLVSAYEKRICAPAQWWHEQDPSTGLFAQGAQMWNSKCRWGWDCKAHHICNYCVCKLRDNETCRSLPECCKSRESCPGCRAHLPRHTPYVNAGR